MIQAARTGILLGLTLAVLVGPVFFALLQTSIHKGFGAGVRIAIGISVSDSLYILVTNFFISSIQNLSAIEHYLSLVGGIVLMIIGIQTFFRKPKLEASPMPNRSFAHNAGLIVRGFLLNFTHPGVLIFWLSVIGVLSTEFSYSINEKWLMYSCTVATIFTTDVLKSYLANKIKRLLTERILLWINHGMGIILVGFGLIFLVNSIMR